MRKSEIISRIFSLLILALMLTWLAENANGQATDTYIGACASQQSCTLASNVSWASGNQVWRFTAYQPNESIRVWIWNHNPTNGHSSQTVQVWVTDDGSVPSLLTNADRWVQACVTDNTTTGAQLKNVSANNPTAAPGANGKATGYTIGMYAVQIAVRITGAAAQAGSPDTFDIGVVQQLSVYPGGPQPGCDSSAAGIIPSNISNLFANNTAGSDGQLNSVEILPCVSINGVTTCGGFDVWPSLFNGNAAGWERARDLSASNNVAAGTTIPGVLLTTGQPAWSVAVQGTAATCSASQASGGAGVEHCATGVTACIGAVAAQGTLFVNLRNGASGGGTIIWNGVLIGTAGTGECITKSFQSPLCGSAATAMTLELSAATAGTVTCATTLEGIDTK